MAVNNIVEYTDGGLQISQPQEGEKHLVYVRPGDRIQLEFEDEIQYRIVDGDVLAVLTNGAQLIFLSLGTMSMTPEQEQIPQIIEFDGEVVDILNIAEISELTDQLKPIEERFLEFQPQSEDITEVQERISRQRETLENTLETINEYVAELSNNAVAGPQSDPNQDGDQFSGDETTVEFVQETVEKIIRAPLETTLEEPINPETETQITVPQVDDNPEVDVQVPQVATTFEIKSLKIYGFEGGYSPSSPANYIGGSGGVEINGDSSAVRRRAAEIINTEDAVSPNNTIQADNPEFIDNQTNTQIIELVPSLPDNFAISSVTISGLPAGSVVYRLAGDISTAGLGSQDQVTDTPVTLTLDDNQLDASKARFLLKYQTNGLSDSDTFEISIDSVAKYFATDDSTPPALTELTATNSFNIVYRELANIIDGESSLPIELNGNVIIAGAGEDSITGGGVADFINAGSGDDQIVGSLGDDTIDGGGGSDTMDYDNDNINNILVDLGDSGSPGSAEVNFDDGDTKTDTLTAVENVLGSAGGDTIIGNSDSNTFFGNGGNDTIQGGLGDDTLSGGLGFDTLSYAYNTDTSGEGYSIILQDNASSTVTGAGETDEIVGFENIIGSSLDDVIAGNSVNNTLQGGDGNDTISGGDGENVLFGDANEARQTVYTLTSSTLELTTSGGDTVDFSANLGGITTDLAENLDPDADPINNVTDRTSGADLGSIYDFENIITTAAADEISAGGSAAIIDNTIFGSYGNDNINSGGSTAVDIATSSAEGVTKLTISGGDTIDYSQLDATNLQSTELDLSTGDATLTGDASDPTALSNQRILGFDHAVGTSASDTITGTGGSNYINAGAGDDIVFGNSGADFLDGGEGSDRLSFAKGGTINSGYAIDYSEANNWFVGTENTVASEQTIGVRFEEFEGSRFVDNFRGSSRSETFIGNAGDDVMVATRGSDTYDGGDGIDSLDYSARGANRDVSENMVSLVTPVVILATQALGTEALAINNLSDNYAAYLPDVDLTGLRIDMANTDSEGYFSALYADRTVDGNAAVLAVDKIQSVEDIKASDKNDFLAGNAIANRLEGFEGNDFIAGRGGDDVLLGGTGDDILTGGIGADSLDGGSGNDWASYQFSNIGVQASLGEGASEGSATGGEGNDTLVGIENLRGTSADDSLTGNSEVNHLIGGEGNDTLAGGGAADTLDGGEGDDTVSFNATAYQNGVNVTLTGTNSTASYTDLNANSVSVALTSIENLIGSTGADQLSGSAGDNIIAAGADNDLIDGGGSGNDQLFGGEGDDIIAYTTRSGVLDGGSGVDTLDLSNTASNVEVDLSNAANQAGLGLNFSATNFENVTAGEGSQTITASSQVNRIIAGGGDDIIYASSGGTADIDNLDGGIGNDTLDFSRSASSGVSANFITDNTITSLSANGSSGHIANNFENLVTTDNADQVVLGDQSTIRSVNLLGSDDTLSIDASVAAELLSVDGGSGFDSLEFLSSDNQNIGVSGPSLSISNVQNGTVIASNFETIQAAGSNDTFASSQSLSLVGSEVNLSSGENYAFLDIETLDNSTSNIGSTFSNVDGSGFQFINAGTGNDVFNINGVDSNTSESFNLDGGGGSDSVNLDGLVEVGNNPITATSINNSTLQVDGLGGISDDYQLTSIETLTGSNVADNWNFSNFGNGSALNIQTGLGNDRVTGSAQADQIDTGDGADTIIGGIGHNIIRASLGDDLIDVNGQETLDYSDLVDDIDINYSQTAAFNIQTSSDVLDIDSIQQLESGDALNIVAGSADDTIAIRYGSTDYLSSFDGGNNELIDNISDGDQVEFSGSLANASIDNAVANFSNIEKLDFQNMDTLANDETLTFNVADLYSWAGQDSSLIDIDILGSREIQINLDDADISSWSSIEFDITGTAQTNPISDLNPSANTLTLSETNNGDTGQVQNTLVEGEQYHIYFNDGGGSGNDLHVVVNVV